MANNYIITVFEFDGILLKPCLSQLCFHIAGPCRPPSSIAAALVLHFNLNRFGGVSMATMVFSRGTIFEDLVGVEDLVLVNSGDLFGE
jgi:hypothetical protein